MELNVPMMKWIWENWIAWEFFQNNLEEFSLQEKNEECLAMKIIPESS